MRVPFVDLKAQYIKMKNEIDSAIQSVIDDTAFVRGSYVEEFEKRYAELYGVKHCISLANGTDALYVAYMMLGIGTGDEVITVANSWISTSETISQTGATPVFVDIDPDYYTIDVQKIKEKITARTKAIAPVHLYGQVAQMDKIQELCKKYNLFLIEDCAQAHLAEFKGKKAGMFGDVATFSFYPSKNLGAYGDAGCIITNNDDLAEKCRMYASHGGLKKHDHKIEGINSRMDGIQAAILSAKLPYLEEWTEARQERAAYYDKYLQHINQIALPQRMPHSTHVYHLYVIRAEKRDELRTYLKEHGIQTSINYPTPLPLLPAYGYLSYSQDDIPVATDYSHTILSLPMYPELSQDAQEYVVKIIDTFYQ